MADLKDTLISGNLRVTDTILTDTIQADTIKVRAASDSETISTGTDGQVLTTDGTNAYWGDATTYSSLAAANGGTDVSLVTTGEKYTWNNKTSNTGTVTSVTINATSPIAIDSNSAITTSGSRTISHANSGVTAGTYKSVTVNATGHVTGGTNPTTLSGYGITDAKIASGTITLGSNTITPLTSGSTLDATKLSGTIPSSCYTDNDTKNTAGSTDSSSKLFLIGATSQAANPQTYSQDTAYVGTDGHLYSNSKQVVNLSDTQALTNKTYNGYTLAAACAKSVVTSIDTSASLPTSNAVKTYVDNAIPSVSDKADKVISATPGNLAGLDSTGNLTDSGMGIDNIPTKNSNNVVKSSGIYNALAAPKIAEKLFDDTFASTSSYSVHAFLKFIADDWDKIYTIRFRVKAWIPNVANSVAVSDVTLQIYKGVVKAYYIKNAIANTSYRPYYSLYYYGVTEAGHGLGVHDFVGIYINSSNTYSYTTKRIYNVQVINVEGCTFEFFDTDKNASQAKGDYSSYYLSSVAYNTYTAGLQETGDTNSTYSALTQANFDTGTETTGRLITAKLLRTNIYTKDEVDALVAPKLAYEVVASLPTASDDTLNKIYLVPSANSDTNNVKDEYVTLRSGTEGSYTYAWEQIGSTSVDLTGYYQKPTTGIPASDIATGVIPNIGSLNTSNITAQAINSSESLSGNIQLHKVAKTGTYSDLIGAPALDTFVTAQEQTGEFTPILVDPTNYYTKQETNTFLSGKQDTLYSGENIKTINGVSLLGDGNISTLGFGSVSSQQDGTVNIVLTNDDVITIDLNHDHQQYLKYLVCSDEAEYNAIETKDSNTLYLIPLSS